jgi:hypothetical protein
MTRSYRLAFSWWLYAALLVSLSACADQPPVAPANRAPAFARQGDRYLFSDPEVYGRVYHQGVRSLQPDLMVTINTADDETSARLKDAFPQSMWVSPGEPYHVYPGSVGFGWYDPRAASECGGLSGYLSGDLASRAREAHWQSATQPPDPSAPELHCIMPGRYHITLTGSGVEQTIDFEYVGVRAIVPGLPDARMVPDAELGGWLQVEPRTYDSLDTYSDHAINFDLHPRARTAQAVLRLQALYSDPEASPFVPEQGQPAITDQTYVRFSARQRSGLEWPGASTYGHALAQYLWDLGGVNPPRGYFMDDSNEAATMRVHQFNHVDQVRSVLVGLRLKEPDNSASDTTLTTFRTLQVTQVTPSAPVACARLEGTTTWRLTDQVLSTGCSTLGSNIRYRWQFDDGGPWTAYSPDTLYDYFEGHSAAGPHTVTVQALDISTGASSTSPFAFSVASDQLLMTGRTFVTNKARNPYMGYRNDTQPLHRYAGYWAERFEGDPQWAPVWSLEPVDSVARIWPAGVYTVDLREQDSTANLLARSRLHITVCNPPSSCEQPPESPRAPAPTAPAMEEWGLFGAGPWLSWGTGSAVRFYDLVGAYDVPSRFTDIAWIEDASGLASATGAGSYLSWSRRALQAADARAFDFTIAATEAAVPFTFGLALDPDLGANAADDQAGYDPARAMVYVFDGARAVGFLLRDAQGRSALQGVTQYGLARRSPLTAQGTWTATRTRGNRLLPGRSDVQLLLTAPPQAGPVTWTFVIVRGANATDLRARADVALAELASNQ